MMITRSEPEIRTLESQWRERWAPAVAMIEQAMRLEVALADLLIAEQDSANPDDVRLARLEDLHDRAALRIDRRLYRHGPPAHIWYPNIGWQRPSIWATLGSD